MSESEDHNIKYKWIPKEVKTQFQVKGKLFENIYAVRKTQLQKICQGDLLKKESSYVTKMSKKGFVDEILLEPDLEGIIQN